MSDHGHSIDIFAADQGGLGLLADGTDLFDLSHMSAPEATPAWATGTAMGAALAGHESLASDLFAPESGTQGEHSTYLQVAGLDQAPLIFPVAHPAAASPAEDMSHDQAPASQTDHVAGTDHLTDHGHSLSLADILADAADDLASFHTAAGGTAGASHVPMGSGFFTPFNPVAALGGIAELAVIDHPILNGHGH